MIAPAPTQDWYPVSIAKLKLTMERYCEPGFALAFTLTENLVFSALNTPATETSEGSDNVAVLLEKIYLVKLVVGMNHSLFNTR